MFTSGKRKREGCVPEFSKECLKKISSLSEIYHNLSQSFWVPSEADVTRPPFVGVSCPGCWANKNAPWLSGWLSKVLSTLSYSFVNCSPSLCHFYLCKEDNIALTPSNSVEGNKLLLSLETIWRWNALKILIWNF